MPTTTNERFVYFGLPVTGDVHDARKLVVLASLKLRTSELYADLHPEDPSGSWDREYCQDGLDEAILLAADLLQVMKELS